MSPLSAGLSDLPFMVMPHPLLPVSLPPASVAMAMNQMSHLSDLANMAAVSQAQTEESKVRLAGKNSTAMLPALTLLQLMLPELTTRANANCHLCVQESPIRSPSPFPTPSDDELHPQEAISQSPSRASSSASSSPPSPAHMPEPGNHSHL